MNASSLNDPVDLRNQHLYQYETLASYLSKAEALATVSLSKGFFEQEEDIQRNYLWVIRDLLTEAEQLNQQLLDEMQDLKNFESSR